MRRAGLPSRCRGGRRPGRAFTLVEILATLALMSIVLPAVMAGLSLCLSTGGLAQQQAQAAALGQAKLMELVVEGQWEQGELSGDFSPDHPGYRWSLAVSDWNGATLEQLDLTVLWSWRGRQRSVTLSTLAQTGGQL